MTDRRKEIERHVKAGRTTKAAARAGDEGTEPPVGSYTDASGVSDLGVDEPVLPASVEDAESRSDTSPTGMYAGETEADRQKEDDFRRTLEERFPGTKGDWKESGAVPDDDREEGEA
jgi:hypothetical protein